MPNKQVLALSLGVVIIIGLIYAGTRVAAPTKPAPTPAPSDSANTGSAKIYLKPATGDLTNGQATTIEIWEDSGTTPVNAVEADLNYDTSKFSIQKIDASGSAFGIDAKSSSAGGKIKVARGNITPLTGDHLIAHINTTPSATGDATLTFASTTALVGSKTNKNVASGSLTGGTYQVR